MEEGLKSVLQIVISYIVVLGIGYFAINFLTNGFITKFISVKSSRGKKYLVEVHAVGDVYYRTGNVFENRLQYTNREKQKKSILVDKSSVVYKAGLKCVFVDDIKNAVLKADFTAVEGFDAVKFDNLLVRAMTNPALQDKFLKAILIMVLIIMLIVFVDTFVLMKSQKAIALIDAKLNYFMNSTQTI